MAQATFEHGKPVMVDYTPGSAVTAGDVVVIGNVPMVAHSDIAANALGAMAVGGGVYLVTGAAAIAAGKKVYWADSTNKVTETSTGNKLFGITVDAGIGGDGETGRVLHKPDGTAG